MLTKLKDRQRARDAVPVALYRGGGLGGACRHWLLLWRVGSGVGWCTLKS